MMYTEENLTNLKYAQLLKIGKDLGVKGGRLKTDKLIQLILSLQEQKENLSTDKSVDENKNSDTGNKTDFSLIKEEFLDDIQFPDSSFSLDSSVDNFDKEMDTSDASPQLKKTNLKKAVIKGSHETTRALKKAANHTFYEKGRNLRKCGTFSLTEDEKCKQSSKTLSTVNISEEERGGRRSLMRSGTFSLPEEDSDKRKSLKRSGAFHLSEEKDKRRSLQRSGTFSISAEEKETRSSKRSGTFVLDAETDKRSSLKRSGTFSLSEEERNKRSSLKRSGTFSLSEEERNKRSSLKRSGTFSLSEEENDKRKSLRSEKLDLSKTKEVLETKVPEVIVSSEDLSKKPELDLLQKQSGRSTQGKDKEKKIQKHSFSSIKSNSGKRKRSSGSSSTTDNDTLSLPTRKKRSLIVPTVGQPVSFVDLSCSEVQTAKDIQYLEENSSVEIPFQTPAQPSKTRSHRRSLRGYLLESRLSAHHHGLSTGIDKAIASQIQVPNASTEVSCSSSSNDSAMTGVEEKTSAIEQECKPLFTIGKTTEESAGGSVKAKKTACHIPRFVSYAKKLQMSRMPNFAKIHEKAFSKMEALNEYEDRRTRLRTKSSSSHVTSSSKKTVKDAAIFKPTVTSINDINIRFTEHESSSLGKNSSSESGKSRIRMAATTPAANSNSDRITTGKLHQTVSTKKLKPPAEKSADSSTSLMRTRVSPHHATSIRTNKAQSGLPDKQSPQHTKGKPNLSALPKLVKENVPPVAWNRNNQDPYLTPGSLQKRKSFNSQNMPRKPRYKPYTGAVRPVADRQTWMKMAERNPKVKTSGELRADQRVYIRGVRTNKRFDLQMASRGIQL